MAYNREDQRKSGLDTELTHQPAHMEGADMADPRGKSSKSPAFQFYPESWFSSSKVQRMSHTERGIYIDLLGYCWLENGLPTDIATLAQMVKLPTVRFARVWQGPLHECFFERGGRLFNARQERERKKQAEHRKDKQKAAVASWESRRNADALQSVVAGDAPAMLSVSISDSVSVSGNTGKRETALDVLFGEFVKAYPECGRHGGALTESAWVHAFDGVANRIDHFNFMVERLENHVASARWRNPKFIPSIYKWLSEKRWLQTLPAVELAATGTEGRGRTGAAPAGKYADFTGEES